MAVIAYVNDKNKFESNNSNHAEERIFGTAGYAKLGGDDMIIDMNAWPCTKGKNDKTNHNCHGLLKEASKNRTITVKISGDIGNYAADHNKTAGAKGTIIYSKGIVVSGSEADAAAASNAKKTADAEANAAKRIANKGKGPKRR
jgi:hypothetical protein